MMFFISDTVFDMSSDSELESLSFSEQLYRCWLLTSSGTRLYCALRVVSVAQRSEKK